MSPRGPGGGAARRANPGGILRAPIDEPTLAVGSNLAGATGGRGAGEPSTRRAADASPLARSPASRSCCFRATSGPVLRSNHRAVPASRLQPARNPRGPARMVTIASLVAVGLGVSVPDSVSHLWREGVAFLPLAGTPPPPSWSWPGAPTTPPRPPRLPKRSPLPQTGPGSLSGYLNGHYRDSIFG